MRLCGCSDNDTAGRLTRCENNGNDLINTYNNSRPIRWRQRLRWKPGSKSLKTFGRRDVVNDCAHVLHTHPADCAPRRSTGLIENGAKFILFAYVCIISSSRRKGREPSGRIFMTSFRKVLWHCARTDTHARTHSRGTSFRRRRTRYCVECVVYAVRPQLYCVIGLIRDKLSLSPPATMQFVPNGII